MIPTVIIPQRQHADDCAVVALSTWLGVPYPQVAAAVATVRPGALVSGMWNTEMQKVARIFGRTLRIKRRFNIAKRPSGILTMEMPDENHAVVLFEGVIVSDGKVWNYHAFMKHAKAKPLCLLEDEGGGK